METSSSKIKKLDELARTVDGLREAGKKIVYCHGVFDLLHIGHIKHLEAARKLGRRAGGDVDPRPPRKFAFP